MLDPHNSNDRKHLLRLHSKEARKNRYDFFSAADFDPVLKDYDAVIGWPGAVSTIHPCQDTAVSQG